MTTPLPVCRRVAAASAALLAGSLLLAPTASAAGDGPGYGGTADKLAVSWKASEPMVAMGPIGMGPSVAVGQSGSPSGVPANGVDLKASGLDLDIFGLGFRGRSEVLVSVGTNDPVTARVDQTGTLTLEVGLEQLQAGPQPGTSVVVLGRAPSGTTRTLVGAVPPLPSGLGPADVIPWLVGVALAAAGALRLRRRDGAATGRHARPATG